MTTALEGVLVLLLRSVFFNQFNVDGDRINRIPTSIRFWMKSCPLLPASGAEKKIEVGQEEGLFFSHRLTIYPRHTILRVCMYVCTPFVRSHRMFVE